MYEESEKCVICRTVTNVLRSTHVDARVNYVDGVGQLCEKCAKGIMANLHEDPKEEEYPVN